MNYVKPTVGVETKQPVFAGACGDFSSSCGNAVHTRGAHGACGDYSSSCGRQVHNRGANGACGDYSSSCGQKVHNRG